MKLRNFWLLSGIPFGVLFAASYTVLGMAHSPLGVPLLVYGFALTIPIQLAHVVASPLAAWMNRDLRRMMLLRWEQFVLLPLAAFSVTLAIGVLTQYGLTDYDLHHPHQMWRITGWANPFPLLCWLYWIWNIWHFGRQNYGVMRLCHYTRVTAWGIGFTITVIAITMFPIAAMWMGIPFITMLLMTGVISINHWTVSIKLASKISGHPWFLLTATLLFGLFAFLWTIATPNGPMLQVIPIILAPFLGLNIIHFLYERQMFKNPIVVGFLK